MISRGEILIVSSNEETRRELAHVFDRQGLGPTCVASIEEAICLLGRHAMALIFCDRHLPDGSYRDFLTASRSLRAQARVVVTCWLSDWDEYLRAMRLGAFDMIATPCRPGDVQWMLIEASRDERARTRALSA
jgi:DNA-binding NtrC family response regulator